MGECPECPVTTSQLLRLVYALCLLGGTCTHLWVLTSHGLLWDYGGAPLFTRVFWTSLAFLDPLAAILVFLRPQVGVVMTLGIIAADVTHNLWWGVHIGLGRTRTVARVGATSNNRWNGP